MASKASHPGVYRGACGRGIFALSDWTVPLRRPEHLKQAKTEAATGWKPGQQLMMKYKYEGNAASPLGKELTVNRKTIVAFVSRHDEHWIKVRSEEGEEGYVPDSYVMANPETVNSLPWLEGQQQKVVPQESAEFKPYKSAYIPKESESTPADDISRYYCRVCEKQLNGPIPFSAHNNSKAHREEMAVQASYAD